jgi:hypothetical protein
VPPPKLGDLEVGALGGYALARGRLVGGQGLGLFQAGYRLGSLTPKLRLTFTSGYTMLAGKWRGVEPGRGRGWFYQNSRIVPLELGLTFEPVSFAHGRVATYVGLAFAGSFAQTSVQRFSLATEQTAGTTAGGTGSVGIRLQVATAVLLLEVRHTELRAGLSGLPVERVLSTTAVAGGLLLSI